MLQQILNHIRLLFLSLKILYNFLIVGVFYLSFQDYKIYISNDEYDFKLGSFYNELEERDDGKPDEEIN